MKNQLLRCYGAEEYLCMHFVEVSSLLILYDVILLKQVVKFVAKMNLGAIIFSLFDNTDIITTVIGGPIDDDRAQQSHF
jgi:hypothetical protein